MSTNLSQPAASQLPAAVVQSGPSLLDRIVEQQAQVASRYQPVMDIDDSIRRYETLKRYIEKVLVEGEDYGRVPGVEKPFLFKSGAQKLCMLFGYVPHYEARVEIEDWSGQRFDEPLFYYQYSCTLTKDGKPVGEGIGSANSWESKYRYRWVPETALPIGTDKGKLQTRTGSVTEFRFAIDKAETAGQYGKPKEYWDKWRAAIEAGEARKIKKTTAKGKEMDAWEMGGTVYRIPNDNFPDVINTCQKQGEKRAYVEATLSATGASQFFTQDEDAVAAMNGTGAETHEQLVQRRLSEEQAKSDASKQAAGESRTASGRMTDEEAEAALEVAKQRMAAEAPQTAPEPIKTPSPKDFQDLRLRFLAFAQHGADVYDQVVREHGTEPGKLYPPTRGKARTAYAALERALAELEPPPYQATDSDLPELLRPVGEDLDEQRS